MRAIKTVGIVAVVLVAAILVYQVFINKQQPQTPETALQKPDTTSTNVSVDNAVPAESETELAESLKLSDAENDTATTQADNQNTQLSSNYPPLASYEIGNEPITDQALTDLVNRLNNDPALLSELINDLRGEADPERLKRLVYILGATGNSAVIPAAEEMIYSGITSSRDTGLDLLSRIAPKNPAAYEVASNLLVSETDPEVLVATMNVMAQPGDTPPELTDSLITQITTLSSHESAAVRGFSVTTLARLSNDPSMAPLFQNALHDSAPAVRSSGVYAFASFPYHSAETSQKLLDMVEDEYESPEVRRGAILALSKNSPDELVRARLDAVESEMRTDARIKRRSGN